MKNEKEILSEVYYGLLKDAVEKYKEVERRVYDQMIHNNIDINLLNDRDNLEYLVCLKAKEYINNIESEEEI